MKEKLKQVIEILTDKGFTISTMESCTGGGLVNSLTNIPGSSEVLKYSAVTYSNEFKIKMGVSKEIIDTYSVYSMNVAREMAKCISEYTGSNIGIGITGKLKKADPNNDMGEDDKVFICIYFYNKYFDATLTVSSDDREDCKKEVIETVLDNLLHILNNE